MLHEKQLNTKRFVNQLSLQHPKGAFAGYTSGYSICLLSLSCPVFAYVLLLVCRNEHAVLSVMSWLVSASLTEPAGEAWKSNPGQGRPRISPQNESEEECSAFTLTNLRPTGSLSSAARAGIINWDHGAGTAMGHPQ